MLHRVREKIGTAGMAVAIVALIAALGGTALAASGALTGKQKKEVEKIAKKFAKAGPTGPTGPVGAPGRDGPEGPTGPEGKVGKSGTNGTSVTNTEFSGVEGTCTVGGSKFVGASTTYACNGKEGSPWTAGGTLPPGATEAGNWSFQVPAPEIEVDVNGTPTKIVIGRTAGEGILVPISFPIKLSANLAASGCAEPELTRTKPCHVHYGVGESGGPFTPGGVCPGNLFAPEAKPGELCVYQSTLDKTTFKAIEKNGAVAPGASTAGAFINFAPNTEPSAGVGSYAVTGCSTTAGTQFECPNP